MKKSFALLTTLLLILVFSLLSVRFVETNLLGSNLNKLKYLHLQATIHMDSLIKFVKEHNDVEIDEYLNSWNDNRYLVNVIPDTSDSSIYYLSIQTKNPQTTGHVRLSQKIIK